jgi:hypothetical protein
MTDFSGILLNENPYKIKDFVGTLLFTQYPTTMIYADVEDNPIVKEWVDTSEDRQVDLFFFYKADKINLKRFIDGQISHIDLINSAKDGYVIFEHFQEDDVLSTTLVSLIEIPLNYKPSSDFFFSKNDGVDTPEITQYFGLDKLELDNNYLNIIKEKSAKSKSETISIHLQKGKGVGTGSINTEVFGRTLLTFDKLYKNIALDHVLGSTRGELSLDAKKNEEYLQYAETEVYEERIRASYGVLIRPITSQLSLFGITESEKIAEKAFDLISKSQNIESLKDEYILHSGFTITSYKQFLDSIFKFQIKMDLTWFNPVNKREFYQQLDYIKANKIIYDIDNLSMVDTNDFSEKGKFRAVNCDTAHYNFVSLGEQQYSGYFDKLLKEGLVQINFIDIYEIKVSRKTVKEAGKQEPKIVDTIIAYFLEK